MPLWLKIASYFVPKNKEDAKKFIMGILVISLMPVFVLFVIFSPGSTGNKDAYEEAYQTLGCDMDNSYILTDIRAYESMVDSNIEHMTKDEAKKRLNDIFLNIDRTADASTCTLKSDKDIVESLKNKFHLTDKQLKELVDNVKSVRNGRQNFMEPLQTYTISRPFSDTNEYMILATSDRQNVISIGDGIVTHIETLSTMIKVDSEHKKQKGLTMTVEYETNAGFDQNMEFKTKKLTITYAMLQNSKVSTGDTVEQGQVLASTSDKYLYFSIKEDGKMIAPTTYINLKQDFANGQFIIPFRKLLSINREAGGSGSFHAGMDLSGGANADVLSINEGSVIGTSTACAPFGGYLGNRCPTDDIYAWGGGNYVLVTFKHNGKDYYVLYCHLATVKAHVGDRLRTGDVLGTQGSSGNSSGTHLHLEIHEGSYLVNPISTRKGLIDPREFIDFKDGKSPQKFN